MCSDTCNFVGASVICAGDANINFTRPQFEFCSILVLDNAIVNLHFPQFTMLEEDKVTDGVSMFVSGKGQLFLHDGFRDVYNVDKELLAKVPYDEVVCDLESVSSYTKEKKLLKQECVQFSLDNVTKLLEHLASFDKALLRSLEDEYVDKVSSGSGTSGTLF